MWDNTLMILTSDNGGYVKSPGGVCNTTDATWPGSGADTDIGHGTACANGEMAPAKDPGTMFQNTIPKQNEHAPAQTS